jgi:hypothetical protein
MIVSASRRTDIPAFYGDWFLNRLKAGYCSTLNSYNEKVSTVSLKREDVDGFVFWTKNLVPFMDKLETIRQMGYPFYVLYTINKYPQALEPNVVPAERSIKCLKDVAVKYGPRAAVWRYDPIIFTSITQRESHIQNFEEIAKELDGSTDEVVISFAQIHNYKTVLRNLNSASNEHGFTWEDPSDEIKLDLAKELADIAKSYDMKLNICCQPQFTPHGVGKAHCVDIRRLSDIAGYSIQAEPKGTRKGCGCYASTDIGCYATCAHGCVYCYASWNHDQARQNYLKHDPNSESLIPIPPQSNPISDGGRQRKQPSLFDFE